MQVQLRVMGSNSEAMVLPQAREVELGGIRSTRHPKPAQATTLTTLRREALAGFGWENAVWAAVAASTLALLAASLIG